MIRKGYISAGAWPGLIFLLGSHFGLLSFAAATGLALIYGLIWLLLVRSDSLIVASSKGLTVFIILAGLDRLFWATFHLGLSREYFFFGLYSSQFLAYLTPVWMSAVSYALGRDRLEDVDRGKVNLAVVWALIWLCCALIALKEGLIFRAAAPLALICLVGGLTGLRFIRRPAKPRPEAEPEDEPQDEPAADFKATADRTGPTDREPSLFDGPAVDSRSASSSGPAAMEARSPAVDGDDLGPVRQALIIQGSLRGGNSITELLIRPFLKGLRSGGARVQVIRLAESDIKPCIGCYSCWVKKPGQCFQRDDMDKLIPLLASSDLVVMAQPTSQGGAPALVSKFLDRLTPLWEPWMISDHQSQACRPLRQSNILGKRLAVVASTSMPDLSEFDPLLARLRLVSRLVGAPITATLLRPGAEVLRLGFRLGRLYRRFETAMFEAGMELARRGRLDPALEQAASQPLFKDRAALRMVHNLFWETWQEYSAAKRTGLDLPPLEVFIDRDVRMNLAALTLVYDPLAAEARPVSIQLDLSGRQPGQWRLILDQEQCRFREGRDDDYDLLVKANSEDWVRISQGVISPVEAAANDLVTMEGDIALFERWDQLFQIAPMYNQGEAGYDRETA